MEKLIWHEIKVISHFSLLFDVGNKKIIRYINHQCLKAVIYLEFFGTMISQLSVSQSAITCSKLTIKTPERRQCRRSCVFIVNFEHILHFVLVFLL